MAHKIAPLLDTHGQPYFVNGDGEPTTNLLPAYIVLDALLEELCHTIADMAKQSDDSYWSGRQAALQEAQREIMHVYGDLETT